MRPVLDAWVQDDRGGAGGGRAGDLHDAGQPRRRRRRRHAADRPVGRDRRAAAHQRYRGHAGGRLSRRDRAARPRITSSSSGGRAPFTGPGVAELLRMLRRDTIIIGGGATNRGVETSVREAFNMDIASVVVRECCWGGDAAAHAYSLDKAMKMYARIRTPRPGRGDAARVRCRRQFRRVHRARSKFHRDCFASLARTARGPPDLTCGRPARSLVGGGTGFPSAVFWEDSDERSRHPRTNSRKAVASGHRWRRALDRIHAGLRRADAQSRR